ncbi:MAG: DNA repair protein RecO [Simkaniaceae bacterium]|nr:DNA repair protein RecO [Simkaniaceae bacterium]
MLRHHREIKTEGIVLRSRPYGEENRIIRLCTFSEGIIDVIVKRITPRTSRIVSLTAPLCRGEYVLRRGRSDLFVFMEGTVTDLHPYLRTSLTVLTCAGNMFRVVGALWVLGKPMPAPYRLLVLYLRHLPAAPDTLVAGFTIKLLLHEGLIVCEKEVIRTAHVTYDIDPDDRPVLALLAFGRDLRVLKKTVVSDRLRERIATLLRDVLVTLN